jgi:hypothetical protein
LWSNVSVIAIYVGLVMERHPSGARWGRPYQTMRVNSALATLIRVEFDAVCIGVIH